MGGGGPYIKRNRPLGRWRAKVELGVYLMSQVRMLCVVDLVHFLHIDVGGRFYSSAMVVFRIIIAGVSAK